MALFDVLQELSSSDFPFARPAIFPLVIPGTTHFENLTEKFYLVILPLFMDEGVLYCRLFAKYAAAFFRISFSSLSRLFSF